MNTDAGRRGTSPGRKGVIVGHYGISVEIALENGERRHVRVQRNAGHAVGDAIVLQGSTIQRLPRRTELRRRDARGRLHLVAANLDVLGVVVAPPAFDGFIDRGIVAARVSGLTPLVVVNKCDLPEAGKLAAAVQDAYAVSAPVFLLSALTGEGLAALRDFLRQGGRGVFIGPTGVGKSSLLNALCPQVQLKTAEVSHHKGMGRHTTTVATLHRVPTGGELIDTPGFRDFGMVDVGSDDLAAHFPSFEAVRGRTCRFSDCRHRTEPGCAVIDLVQSGAIALDRYESYQALLAEIEAEEAERRRREWGRRGGL